MALSSYQKGLFSEIYAVIYLVLHGYWPLSWRYKTPSGEIDLIMRRGRSIVFVEVKARADEGSALVSVSLKSQSRIRRAADNYILGLNRKSSTLCYEYRFDVVAVYKNILIRHIKNAF